MDDLKEKRQQASFMYSMKAVVWSFFGLRRKSDFDTDSAKLNPLHIVIAALLAVAMFIGLLITVVKLVVPK
ncbi:DUF2970 domain-containing protein [Massilia sp. BJB1822]|uniref:DUF2970 domain-containing protein n=1 Tax=Massilia sp. BJB1822 TaxID=2744470 RepID=UPI001593EA3C|nr:DUF2970 domain-containing protein [Massilia sp. BJB1822]NVE01057.1 DUF2970 domain-containing protein [Massilia sp. BJB1822]